MSHRALEYVRQRLWSEEQWVIYERTLSDGISFPRAIVTRRELGLRELVELGYFKALEFPDALRSRIDSGNLCHGFFEGDRLATIGWSSPGYLELDVDLRVPCPNSIGMYDFLTYKEFRSKGYYTNALNQLLAVMSHAGYSKALIAVSPNNSSSRRGIEKAGFRQALRVMRRARFGVREIYREELV